MARATAEPGPSVPASADSPPCWIHAFGTGDVLLGREDKALLGGKGANLAEMSRIGLPVPPGFTITTEACRHYLREGRVPDGLWDVVDEHLDRLEEATGKRLGDGGDAAGGWNGQAEGAVGGGGPRRAGGATGGEPLLLSVRSGGPVSMPGMMDTVLNLGLNDGSRAALARTAGDERFSLDCHRRLIQMYGEVVLGIDVHRFEALLAARRGEAGVEHDHELDAGQLRALVEEYREVVRDETGAPFPDDPREQLRGAVLAVFRSWANDRARAYRRASGISEALGTAVNVQTMVFGNLGPDSGSGVAFTRDPATGRKILYGEFLVNAQGEDVVAGIRDPLPLDQMSGLFPEAWEGLREIRDRLEEHYREMQDLEFTVEREKLWILQTRTGQRTAQAAVRIAVELVDEGLIEWRTALGRVDADSLDQLLHPQVEPGSDVEELARGLPASPGAAAGRAVFSAARARERADAGEAVILVRRETSPDDFDGMMAATGVLTARGGMTSHAAVVARGIGKCCVVGAAELEVREDEGWMTARGERLEEGTWITLDGTGGRVLRGRVPTVEPEPSVEFARLMGWADEVRHLRVRANADTPRDAARARERGAEGIGLCRTEHMFFEGERLHVVREMILAGDAAGRRRALEKILPMQREDFAGIFEAMDGLPVTVRLLDPPLNEFLPRGEAEIREVAGRMGLEPDAVAAAVARHREANPMLGHRGVRLATTFPEITEMQARALFEAAVEAVGRGIDARPEIMVPVVGAAEEVRRQAVLVRETAEAVFAGAGREVEYLVGTMIELPRAALTAGEIAGVAEFFSFGTNDLTQTTFGLSRDDAGSFLPLYLEEGILPDDPFRTLDVEGVGRLVRLAVEEGREARPGLKVGICGEHGGDPRSVRFFHDAGLDYVSCSPFRIPVARLAAAQAAL